MKALKVEPNVHHVLLLEDGDRFIHLTGDQVAVVLGEDEGKENTLGEVKVSVHFPDIDKEKDLVPFTVSMAAAVKEFLNDPEWVAKAHKRIEERHPTKRDV